MRQKHVYLILAVLGFIVPYYFLISFLTAQGLSGTAFVQALFGTRISIAALDLILSCVVFVSYLRREAVRCSIAHWWLYLAALLTVGLSFALPLFLYFRESRIEVKGRAS
jgi:hypothetical protein